MKKPARCFRCGGKRLVSRRVTRSFGQRRADLVVVENVPVVACLDCGESLIHASALKRIEGLRRRTKQLPTVKIPVVQIG